MKETLYLFTRQYPFDGGDSAFIEAEVELLSRYYRLVIVVSSSHFEGSIDHAIRRLPDGVELICCQEVIKLAFYKALFLFFFSKAGRKEMRRICGNKKSLFGRIKASLYYYAVTYCYHEAFKKAGVFHDADRCRYYTFWFDHATLACAIEKERRPDLKLISRIHGYDLYNERRAYEWQPFQLYKAQYVDKLVFVASRPREYFVRTFGGERFSEGDLREKTNIVYLGTKPISQPGFSVADSETTVFTIVSCSNVIPLKRVDLIAEALKRISDKSMKWVHFGDGPEMPSLKRHAEETSCVVELRGAVPHDDVLDYYQNNPIDVFITTSSTEGCPVSIQEAMAAGLPIIATDVGGIPDEIDGNGVLLKGNPTIEEVAAAICLMRDMDRQDRARMGRRSRALWEERFVAAENAKKMLQLIESM